MTPKKGKTHFEQVPLEHVRQIAREELEKESSADTMQTPRSAEQTADWKDLCKAIIVEQDPKRFTQLAEQLDKALAQRRKPAS